MSLLAGLSTTLGAGAVLALPGQRVSRSQMAFALALAGGVMLTVTLLEFWMPLLVGGGRAGPVFFYSAIGAVAFLVLSYMVPEPPVVDSAKQFGMAPAEGSDTDAREDRDIVDARRFPSVLGQSTADCAEAGQAVPTHRGRASAATEAASMATDAAEEDLEEAQRRRWRLAVVLMLALTAHNFPEGFAVAISAMQSDRLGLVVMFAIALHNIPEGISIALPVYSATGSKWKAVFMSFLSGMAEPLGAITALLVVRVSGGGMSEASMENLLCTVGGVMCAVALKELLPEAWRQGRPVAALSGLACGAVAMWVASGLGA